jgi:tripartite-type tricarboxylate transporter receptor subunit TctC
MAQPKRAGVMPEVSTMAEQGMPGFDTGIWIGLMAPVGTPKEIVEKLAAGTSEALTMDTVKTALNAQGIDPLGGTPAEFAAFIREDIDKWVAVLKSAGLSK